MVLLVITFLIIIGIGIFNNNWHIFIFLGAKKEVLLVLILKQSFIRHINEKCQTN